MERSPGDAVGSLTSQYHVDIPSSIGGVVGGNQVPFQETATTVELHTK